MQVLGPGVGLTSLLGFMMQRMFLGGDGVGWGTSESPVFAQADGRERVSLVSELGAAWYIQGAVPKWGGDVPWEVNGKMGHSQPMEEHSSLISSYRQ